MLLPPAASQVTGGSLALSTPQTGTFVVGDPAQAMSITRPGQTARYTFSGTAAQTLRFNWSSTLVAGSRWVDVTVVNPSGGQVSYSHFYNGQTGGMDICGAADDRDIHDRPRSRLRHNDVRILLPGDAMSATNMTKALMKTMARFVSVVVMTAGFTLLMHGGIANAQTNLCVQAGGAYICTGPVHIGEPRYSLCDDQGPYLYRIKGWCLVRGGTWDDAHGQCTGTQTPDNPGNASSRATAFEE